MEYIYIAKGGRMTNKIIIRGKRETKSRETDDEKEGRKEEEKNEYNGR